jgi:putative ABC transport system permease protein
MTDLRSRFLKKIKELTENDYEISRTSRLEQQEEMSDAKRMMYILGGGIAVVLALIGILNFINVMATGITARRMEFAMLESVGMTKRQMRRVLILEGLGYAGATMLLTATLGMAITYGLFELFRQQADYAVFSVPFMQIIIAAALVFTVCTIVPVLAYRSSSRTSIVERLREAE